MSNIYFMCDNCGIETNGITFVNGMKFCAKCYHQIFGKDNQQTEITQLKQQLAEKEKEINSLIVDYEKRISQEQELMSNMEHRLTEKQKTIDEINKEFVQAVHDWKTLCAKKDEGIECYKNKSYIDMLHKEMLELKLDTQTQLAIQKLEEVNAILYESHYKKIGNKYYAELEDIENVIDQQIKELKGEKDEN